MKAYHFSSKLFFVFALAVGLISPAVGVAASKSLYYYGCACAGPVGFTHDIYRIYNQDPDHGDKTCGLVKPRLIGSENDYYRLHYR